MRGGTNGAYRERKQVHGSSRFRSLFRFHDLRPRDVGARDTSIDLSEVIRWDLQGHTKGGKKEERKPQIEEAASKIMIDIAKIRLRGRGADGDEDEETDEIAVCHAHFPRRTVKREVIREGGAYSACFDDLARYMQEYKPRFLVSDFNMALHAVVPEPRGVGAVTRVGVGSDALH